MTRSCLEKILQNQQIKSPETSEVFNNFAAPKVNVLKSIIFLCTRKEQFEDDK